ncbi:MAG TPA: hypothetical protein VJT31_06850, partial [Rugosimonospora sp.]|nr:hypothetical protein [Rugosimonospora sp.]
GAAVLGRSGGCAELRSQLRQQVAGGPGEGTCVEPAPTGAATAADIVARLRGAAVSPAAIQVLPAFCGTIPVGGGWFYYYTDRTQECRVDLGRVFVVRTIEGQNVTVGFVDVGQVSYAYTTKNSLTWHHQVQIGAVAASGDVAGMTVGGSFNCLGACTVTGSSFPQQPVLTGIASGEGTVNSTLGSGTATGTTTNTYLFKKPNAVDSNPLTITAPPVRCDNVLPGNAAGCVFANPVPTMVFRLSDSRISQEAQHIRDAQASGLPGAYPNPLSRTTDASIQADNTRIACPRQDQGGYPRPTGYECDEYPFKSTYQGALANYLAGGTARTFPYCQISGVSQTATGSLGWSVCMIIASHNSTGGALLGAFYSDNRVINNDLFYASVEP